MPDNIVEGPVRLRTQFPVLRIFEAANVALSPGSIVVALVTTVLIGLCGWCVDGILHVDASSKPHSESIDPVSRTIESLRDGRFQVTDHHLAGPWSSVAAPAITALTSDAGLSTRLNGLTRFVLALAIWSFSGVVLCRRAAFLLVGNDESTLRRALGYGLGRWRTTVCNPLIPLGASFLICLIMAAFGLLGRLPAWGSMWLFIISPIAAILGFVMAFLLLATMLSWPLMVAAVSVDDCESFGGLSRAYSLVTGRPWHTVAYVMLGLLVGAILTSVSIVIGETSIWCGMSTTALTSGDEQLRRSLLSPLTTLIHALVRGVETSYFWSAATVVYLLLRQDVDGVPLDRVAVDDQDRPPRDPLPVVGMPATDATPAPNQEILAINR